MISLVPAVGLFTLFTVDFEHGVLLCAVFLKFLRPCVLRRARACVGILHAEYFQRVLPLPFFPFLRCVITHISSFYFWIHQKVYREIF